jgi:two-component system invasion response regulator UvrY
MIRVVIVDDHPIVRDGLRQILAETEDVALSGEASNADEAMALLRRTPWDVIVVDLNLPGRDGLELMTDIRAEWPKAPVVVLSIHREISYAARALRLGAAGYITKGSARDDLINAIRAAAHGQRIVPASLAADLAIDLLERRPGRDTLSEREIEVLRRIALGQPPREIAHDLNVSVKTVATHRSRVLEKLHLKSNAELVRYAVTENLIE